MKKKIKKKVIYQCGLCGKKGHNKRSCSLNVNKQKLSCGKCREIGHTRVKCPKLDKYRKKIKCKKCKKRIIKQSYRTKYCSECQIERRREQQRIAQKKRRDKMTSEERKDYHRKKNRHQTIKKHFRYLNETDEEAELRFARQRQYERNRKRREKLGLVKRRSKKPRRKK